MEKLYKIAVAALSHKNGHPCNVKDSGVFIENAVTLKVEELILARKFKNKPRPVKGKPLEEFDCYIPKTGKIHSVQYRTIKERNERASDERSRNHFPLINDMTLEKAKLIANKKGLVPDKTEPVLH